MLFVIAAPVRAVNLGARLQFEDSSISTCFHACVRMSSDPDLLWLTCVTFCFVATCTFVVLLGLLMLVSFVFACPFVCVFVLFCIVLLFCVGLGCVFWFALCL